MVLPDVPATTQEEGGEVLLWDVRRALRLLELGHIDSVHHIGG